MKYNVVQAQHTADIYPEKKCYKLTIYIIGTA